MESPSRQGLLLGAKQAIIWKWQLCRICRRLKDFSFQVQLYHLHHVKRNWHASKSPANFLAKEISFLFQCIVLRNCSMYFVGIKNKSTVLLCNIAAPLWNRQCWTFRWRRDMARDHWRFIDDGYKYYGLNTVWRWSLQENRNLMRLTLRILK